MYQWCAPLSQQIIEIKLIVYTKTSKTETLDLRQNNQ